MAEKPCGACNLPRLKSQYSKTQWGKGEARLCVECVTAKQASCAGGGGNAAAGAVDKPAERASVHLQERQAERGIADEQLAAAKREGERIEYSDTGTVVYRHKGVVYVTAEGVGVTAYRMDPPQCTCVPGSNEEAFGNDQRASGRAGAAIGRIQIGCMKADQDADRRGRAPSLLTEATSRYLETVQWSSPQNRELLGMRDSGMLQLLLLCAAGSLLVPIRCGACHGVQKLKRSVHHAMGRLDEEVAAHGSERFSRSHRSVLDTVGWVACSITAMSNSRAAAHRSELPRGRDTFAAASSCCGQVLASRKL